MLGERWNAVENRELLDVRNPPVLVRRDNFPLTIGGTAKELAFVIDHPLILPHARAGQTRNMETLKAIAPYILGLAAVCMIGFARLSCTKSAIERATGNEISWVDAFVLTGR